MRPESRHLSLLLLVVCELLVGAGVVLLDPSPAAFLAVLSLPFLTLFALKQPQAMLAAFLFAGAFKAVVRIPGDLTVALCAVVVVVAIVRISREGMPVWPQQLWLFVAVCLMVVVGVFYTTTPDYALDKVARLLTFGSVALFAPLVLIRSEDELLRFMRALTVIGAVMSVAAVAEAGSAGFSQRFTVFGSNTIALARAAALGFAGAAVWLIARPKSFWWTVPLCLTATWAILGSGSRGPLIGLALGLGTLILVRVTRKGATRTLVAVGVVVGLGLLVTSVAALPTISLSRYALLLQDDPGYSATARLVGLRGALQLGASAPFTGVGTGSFASAFPMLKYPHNMLAEVFAENGVVTLVGLLALLCAVSWRALTSSAKRGSPAADFVLVALVMSILNALVSGDLNDNRLLYAFLAIAASLPFLSWREREREREAETCAA
jgi:O-antigen ligase